MAAVLASLAVLLLSAACLLIGWRREAWGLIGLGLLVLVALPLYVVVLGLVITGTVLGAAYAFRAERISPEGQLRAVQRRGEARRRDIAEVIKFARAVAAVQTQTVLSAKEQVVLIAEQCRRSRKNLQSLGQLTPEVAAQLEHITQAAMSGNGALAADVTRSLEDSFTDYSPGSAGRLGRIASVVIGRIAGKIVGFGRNGKDDYGRGN